MNPWTAFVGAVWGLQLVYKAYAGDPDMSSVCTERLSALPEAPGPVLFGLAVLVLGATEALAVIGERERAHALYPWVLEVKKRGMVVVNAAVSSIETSAGIAAACGGDWETAERHHETALQQAEAMPHKILQPETRRWYARMLLDRDAPGDRDKARTLLGEATEMYQTIGMPKHLEMVEKMSAEL